MSVANSQLTFLEEAVLDCVYQLDDEMPGEKYSVAQVFDQLHAIEDVAVHVDDVRDALRSLVFYRQLECGGYGMLWWPLAGVRR